jgi:hypothetical protein
MARTKKCAKLTPTKHNPREREDEETRALSRLKYKCMPIRWKREKKNEEKKKKKKKKKTNNALLKNTTTQTTGTRKKRERRREETGETVVKNPRETATMY